MERTLLDAIKACHFSLMKAVLLYSAGETPLHIHEKHLFDSQMYSLSVNRVCVPACDKNTQDEINLHVSHRRPSHPSSPPPRASPASLFGHMKDLLVSAEKKKK